MRKWLKGNKHNLQHGLYGAPGYRSWECMLSRCRNPKDPFFANYGGRGIKVCERWRSVVAFFEDMGPRPSPKHSIERIDNDGDYEPGNCKWATIDEQARNRRRPKGRTLLTYGGKTQSLTRWAEDLGVSRELIGMRLRRGKTVGQALGFEE